MKKALKLIITTSLLSVLIFGVSCNTVSQDETQEINFAIPYDDNLQHLQDSYYIQWLEKQCDVKINLTFISQSNSEQYLNSMLTYADGDIDGILFSDDTALDIASIEQYAQSKSILPLSNLIENNSIYLKDIIANYEAYNLESALFGNLQEIYFMPALSGNLPKQYTQTMWINLKYLEECGVAIPSTTAEFEQVLSAFKENYSESLPIIGTSQNSSFFPINFIMNSFEVCDAQNSYFAIKNGDVYFAPQTDDFREGLIYCANLYNKGLLSKEVFTFDDQQFKSIVNDPRMLVGMFSSFNVSDVLNVQSPELYSYYLPLAPLKHEGINANSILHVNLPKVGGVILASTDNAQKTFEIMDLMCSEQAYLIGHFGEPGVDWKEAEPGDISTSGLPALISVTNTQALQREDIFSAVIGPFITIDKFAEAITWKGYQVNQNEYLQARAFRIYEEFETEQSLSPLFFAQNQSEYEEMMLKIEEYTLLNMIDFITGEKDINSDEHWQEYLNGFEHVEQIELAIQQNFNSNGKN